ncbi:MAG: hypothetical protein HYY51_00160 [Candidatus Magasanikbacteria bacterium]|nr:hypothetical protein [Candidatus Magasanikbacteria bacterium]
MYLSWGTHTIQSFREHEINALYDEGYLFTRLEKGIMNKTRSIRIKCPDFSWSSENRRILKKTESLMLKEHRIPYSGYDWRIAKMAKNFYDTKFGAKTFSANKIKELLTNKKTTNFNLLLEFYINTKNTAEALGYAICAETEELIHYAYPFYRLDSETCNMGMGMMLQAIEWARGKNKKYIYLGSAQRPGDIYKLQFKGLEWYDGQKWQSDENALKTLLKN